MDRRERSTIELDEQGEPVSGLFVPSFAERFRVLGGRCTVCGCLCQEHVENLGGDRTGWRGCTYALLQEVTRLRKELAARK